jgi:ribulose-5-phosphate 4-epimerase/fuculose-1-phosphate aldolase
MNAPAVRIHKPVREQVSKEEWQTRVDLAACYRLMHEFGMVEMIANHLSARVPGTTDEFLINPYGMLYEELTASCMIKIDIDGKVLFNDTEFDVNQAGYVIHSAIHGARHDVECIIHTHTLPGMAVSAMKCGLMPIAQTSLRWAKGVSYHAYEGIALNLDERERLVQDLGDTDAMILKNHGLLTCGPSIPECFNNMYRLERACQLQVMTLSCNTEIELPPQEVVNEAWRLFQPGVRRRFGLLEWPALLRKLDKVDTSYRN